MFRSITFPLDEPNARGALARSSPNSRATTETQPPDDAARSTRAAAVCAIEPRTAVAFGPALVAALSVWAA
jgi:hypothetical protein